MILTTKRLILRELNSDDATFLVGLLNEPSFLHYIGDRGVRSEDDALRYLESGPLAHYRDLGFGLWAVCATGQSEPMGICGLLQRKELEHCDIGFAFRPQFWGQGFAFEAAHAVLDYGHRELGLETIVAITSVDNERSGRLLEKLGLRFDRLVTLSPQAEPSKLFVPS